MSQDTMRPGPPGKVQLHREPGVRGLLYAAAVVCLLASWVGSVVIQQTVECPAGYYVVRSGGVPFSDLPDFCVESGTSPAEAFDDATPAVRYDARWPRRIAVFGTGLVIALILIVVAALRVRDRHGLLFRDSWGDRIWLFWIFLAIALGLLTMSWASCVRSMQ